MATAVPPVDQPQMPYRQTNDRDAETAKTLVLVAMIFQIIFIAIGLFFFVFLLGVLWLILDYVLVYSKISEGRLNEAETPCLVLAILQLILGGVIPGILMIIAYVKIKDAIRSRMPAPSPPPSF